MDYMKLTLGYSFSTSSTIVAWSIKKKPTIYLSTTEATSKAAMTPTCEELWLRRTLEDLHEKQEQSTQLICDNQSAIQMTNNLFFHKKTKHIDIQYHFVHDLVQQCVIKIMYYRTEEHVVDIFTKALPKEKLCKFIDDLEIFPNNHYGGEMLE
jgi:hypothetical protein